MDDETLRIIKLKLDAAEDAHKLAMAQMQFAQSVIRQIKDVIEKSQDKTKSAG